MQKGGLSAKKLQMDNKETKLKFGFEFRMTPPPKVRRRFKKDKNDPPLHRDTIDLGRQKENGLNSDGRRIQEEVDVEDFMRMRKDHREETILLIGVESKMVENDMNEGKKYAETNVDDSLRKKFKGNIIGELVSLEENEVTSPKKKS